MHFQTFLRIPLIMLLATCCAPFQRAGIRQPQAGHMVAIGTWGGEHVVLEVSRNVAEVEFDCARGQISQPIVINEHGDFDLAGTYTPEHGGPVLRDEAPPRLQARYSGHVEGDAMSLTVTLEKDKTGPFTLRHDQQPNLRKCR